MMAKLQLNTPSDSLDVGVYANNPNMVLKILGDRLNHQTGGISNRLVDSANICVILKISYGMNTLTYQRLNRP